MNRALTNLFGLTKCWRVRCSAKCLALLYAYNTTGLMLSFSVRLRLARPHHWLKNGFVFVGPVFSHAWMQTPIIFSALLAFAAFCLVASAVYVTNDILDVEADRTHPTKRNRPIACRMIDVQEAWVYAVLLSAGGLWLAWMANPKVLAIVLGYALLNLAYSLRLKHVVIVDVFVIAAGFMLRILAGTIGIGIAPSKWLIVCGLMITLFLGFAKRRAELATVSEYGYHRRVLDHYTLPLLDKLIGVSASGAIITYCLYTVAPETVAVHHTENLVYTAPLVLYAMFRYLYLLHKRGQGEDPATDLFRDAHILGAVMAWAALMALMLA